MSAIREKAPAKTCWHSHCVWLWNFHYVWLYAVVVDAKHEKAKAFYTKLGFIACRDSPLSLYLPVATLEQPGGA